MIKAKHQAAYERLTSIFRQRPVFETGQFVWVYDDKNMISGSDKHVQRANRVYWC